MVYLVPGAIGFTCGVYFAKALVLTLLGQAHAENWLYAAPAIFLILVRKLLFGNDTTIGGIIHICLYGGMLLGGVGFFILTLIYNSGVRVIIVPH
jgi:hypothetical protein